MTQPQPQSRSSLAIALQDYHHILGVRPGLALTVAAIALIAAAGLAIGLLTMLGSSSRAIADGRQTVRALHRYNAALEVWRQMSAQPDSALQFPEQRRLRDSIANALRTEFAGLESDLSDSTDRRLIGQVLADFQPDAGRGPNATFNLGVNGRSAMIVLTARQDTTLLRTADQSQQAQFFAAILFGLTTLAAVALIVPMAWAYVRFKQGIPPGL